jgi:hypothetical protein
MVLAPARFNFGLVEPVPPIAADFFAMRGVCAGNLAASLPASRGAMQIVEGFPAGRGKTDTANGWGNEAPPKQKKK